MPLEFPLAFLIIAVVVYLVAYYKVLVKPQENNNQQDAVKLKGFQIIHNAIKKAQVIISEAELEGIKIGAQRKVENRKLEDYAKVQYQQAILDIEHTIQQSLNKFDAQTVNLSSALSKAQNEYSNYLVGLHASSDLAQKESLKIISSRVNLMFDRIESQLTQAFNQAQTRSLHAVELEIRSARQLIDTYKQQQLKIIDENAISLLETALSMVIPKKLTLQDQIDLVYEALEKAKAEKFIV